MEKAPQPLVVTVAPSAPGLIERAIGWVGMIGGGLLGAKFGLDAYGGISAKGIDLDVTKPAPWEAVKAPRVEPEIALRNSEIGVSGLMSRLGMQSAKVEGSTRRPITSPPSIVESVGDSWPKDKPVPRVVSAGAASTLKEVKTGHVELSHASITRHENGYSAVLHTEGGSRIHIPHVKQSPYNTIMEHMNVGETVALRQGSQLEMLAAPGSVIDEALNARKLAIAEHIPGLKKPFWGSLKSLRDLDGAGKFNVGTMVLMGVVMGGFVASGIQALYRGASSVVSGGSISHQGRITNTSEIGSAKPR